MPQTTKCNHSAVTCPIAAVGFNPRFGNGVKFFHDRERLTVQRARRFLRAKSRRDVGGLPSIASAWTCILARLHATRNSGTRGGHADQREQGTYG